MRNAADSLSRCAVAALLQFVRTFVRISHVPYFCVLSLRGAFDLGAHGALGLTATPLLRDFAHGCEAATAARSTVQHLPRPHFGHVSARVCTFNVENMFCPWHMRRNPRS